MKQSGRLPYFSFYTSDYLSGTREMSSAARGVYVDLLCYQWENGSLPATVEALARLSPDVASVWSEVSAKFVQRDGRLFNERLESERQKAIESAERFSARGRKGANALHNRATTPISGCFKHASSMQQACNEHASSMARAYVSVSESESDSESESGSRESVRGSTERAIAEAIEQVRDTNGSTLAYLLNSDPVVQAVWRAIPPKFATERTKNLPRIAAAVDEITREEKVDRANAGNRLISQIVAYCTSPVGQTRYRGKLTTWLDGGRWRESDEAWQVGPEQAESEGPQW